MCTVKNIGGNFPHVHLRKFGREQVQSHIWEEAFSNNWGNARIYRHNETVSHTLYDCASGHCKFPIFLTVCLHKPVPDLSCTPFLIFDSNTYTVIRPPCLTARLLPEKLRGIVSQHSKFKLFQWRQYVLYPFNSLWFIYGNTFDFRFYLNIYLVLKLSCSDGQKVFYLIALKLSGDCLPNSTFPLIFFIHFFFVIFCRKRWIAQSII